MHVFLHQRLKLLKVILASRFLILRTPSKIYGWLLWFDYSLMQVCTCVHDRTWKTNYEMSKAFYYHMTYANNVHENSEYNQTQYESCHSV